ncbi:unnamed protein product [Cutaneotrichosporon oleaginosum]
MSDSHHSAEEFAAVVLVMTAIQAALRNTPQLTAVPLIIFPDRSREQLQWWLRHDHPGAMHAHLGVEPSAFRFILHELESRSTLRSTRGIQSGEKLAHFLYICRANVGLRHAAETFQKSISTISHHVYQVIDALTERSFYERWISMPKANTPVPSQLANSNQFHPYFKDVIGAIDGTHIPAHVPNEDRQRYRDRKGNLSFNVLAVCSMDLRFIYLLVGFEGSAADSTLFAEALNTDLRIPEGRSLLADAGFGMSPHLLTPYRQVRYHLKEYARGRQAPLNPKELYNLRHASARNVIERIFGVLKNRFRIVAHGTKYPVRTQLFMILSVCVLHNMLRSKHVDDAAAMRPLEDPAEADPGWDDDDNDDDDEPLEPSNAFGRTRGIGILGMRDVVTKRQFKEAVARRDAIAQSMWDNWRAPRTR